MSGLPRVHPGTVRMIDKSCFNLLVSAYRAYDRIESLECTTVLESRIQGLGITRDAKSTNRDARYRNEKK